MAIAIQPYTPDRIEAVKAFNRRLTKGGIEAAFHFPESHIPIWLPPREGSGIYQQYYLAVENETVRGGFILKFQDFLLGNEIRPVVYYHLPVSEGIVNKAYSSVGVHMLRSALKMHPMLFALGMGGFDRPLPTMLKAMGWSMSAVPFYFKVNRAARFLRNIAPLRSSLARKIVADVAALSGIGWAGIRLAQIARTKKGSTKISDITTSALSSKYDSWRDELWQRCSANYSFVAVRDCQTLQRLYSPDKNFICLKVHRGSQPIGWAVAMDSQMHNNKYFGDLRLGSIVDCLADPIHAAAIVAGTTSELEKRGVDLIVSNHSHPKWGEAFRACGYFAAPSNFIFAASVALSKELARFDANHQSTYFMRGDGDGPVNL